MASIISSKDIPAKVIFIIKNIIFDTDDCILWPKSLDKDGYGIQVFHFNGRRYDIKSHRLTFMIFYGDIPIKMMVCHTCDNPSCINPKHLWLGSQLNNMQDCYNKGRYNVAAIVKGQLRGHKINRANSKLSDQDILDIRKSYVRGRGSGYALLARKYGVGIESIRRIVLHQIRNNI